MNKILLINEGNSDNLGDKAIRHSLEYVILKLGLNCDFEDFTFKTERHINERKKNTITNNVKKFILRLIPINILWLIKNYRNIMKIKNMNQNIAIIGGGQLLLNNANFPIALLIWSSFFKGKKVIFAAGCGENFSLINKYLISRGLKNIDKIFLRDSRSITNFKKYFNYEVEHVPDVAFLIDEIYKYNLDEKVFDIAVGFANYQDYKKYNNVKKNDYVIKCINKIKELKKNYSSIQLFYTTSRDKVFAREIMEMLGVKDSVKLSKTDTLEELLTFIPMCKKIISNRMHALIIAMSYNCDVEALQMSDKISGFIKEYIENTFSSSSVKEDIREKIKECTKI